MKRLLITTVLVVFCICNVNGQNIKQKAIKPKYENVFYRTSSTKYAPFVVESIVYSTSFMDKESKYKYQISINGTLKGDKKTLLHNVQSTEDLEYYKKVFNSRYKRINLYFGKRKMGDKMYFNTSIGVEY